MTLGNISPTPRYLTVPGGQYMKLFSCTFESYCPAKERPPDDSVKLNASRRGVVKALSPRADNSRSGHGPDIAKLPGRVKAWVADQLDTDRVKNLRRG